MPVFITLLITKTIQKLSRLVGQGGGSALPGLVAEKIDPKIVSKLIASLPQGSIVVTGTNGKTTTTKMLAAILEKSEGRVITNRSGSNLTRGIASSLIDAADLAGKLPGEIGLFEVDEASMPDACRLIKPKRVIVLNLFRDQLDRYGELDQTANMISRGLEQLSGEVYLNADDPLVASLGLNSRFSGEENRELKFYYFGVQESPVSRLEYDRASDSDHCPVCGRALEYSRSFFGHIGHYRCPKGDFERPTPNYSLFESSDGATGEVFEVMVNQRRVGFSIELPGLYNAYNALAAIAVASQMGIHSDQIAAALHKLRAAFGRVEKIEFQGRQLLLLLIKNPTGFNQVIQTFLTQESEIMPMKMLVAINDKFADGRDVSWLWDVAIESLVSTALRQKLAAKSSGPDIIVSGIRAYDMALRLKYAGIGCRVEPDLKQALKVLVESTPEGQTGYVLPTYTAMFELRQLITKEAGLEGFWK